MRTRIVILFLLLASSIVPAHANSQFQTSELVAAATEELDLQAQALVPGHLDRSESMFLNFQNRALWLAQYRELEKYANVLSNDFTNVDQAQVHLAKCSQSVVGSGGWLDCEKTFSLTFGVRNQEATTLEYVSRARIGWQSVGDTAVITSLTVSAANPQELLPVDDPYFSASALSGRKSRIALSSGVTYLTSAQKLLVVSYALTWALDYNGAYDYYPETDCANFASQSLFAGGWKKIGDLQSWQIYDRDYWNFARPSYTIDSYATNTWINANELFQFTTVNSLRGLHFATYDRDTAASHQTELFPGDLVFVRWDTNATPVQKDHVAIVTNRGNGIVKISSHTSARRNLPFSMWIEYASSSPRARYFFVRT